MSEWIELPLDEVKPKEDFYTGTAGWIPGGQGTPGKAGLLPRRYLVPVPREGIYRVQVELQGSSQGAFGLTLTVGRRSIVKRGFSIAPGERYRCTFLYRVCPYRPVVGWQQSVTDFHIGIGLLGEGAVLHHVRAEETEAPTLWLAGDSLVRDYEGLYPYNPLMNGGSWGQNLLQYLEGYAVVNQAHSGLTTKCFREDGHWEIIEKRLRPGDVFLMEFGHNDQKRRNLKPYDQYAANIRWYAMTLRDKGVQLILVTPMSRIPVRDRERNYDLLEDYADSLRRIGRELDIPVIDLHAYSFQAFSQMGIEKCQNYFTDTTHTNDYGAAWIGFCIAAEIRRLQIAPLCQALRSLSRLNWEPDEGLRPEAGLKSSQIEEHPNLNNRLRELPYEDCRNLEVEKKQILQEAMDFGLLDPCIRYMHPSETIPRAQFVYILLKALRVGGGRPYRGAYCDLSASEFDAEQIQTALEETLIDLDTTQDRCFRPDDPLTIEELISFAVRGSFEREKRDLSLSKCMKLAGQYGWIGQEDIWLYRAVNRLEAIEMTVKLCRKKFGKNGGVGDGETTV